MDLETFIHKLENISVYNYRKKTREYYKMTRRK